MIILEATDNRTGIAIEIERPWFDHHDVHGARVEAIRLFAYAGFLNFEKDNKGDLVASNSKFDVNITRV